MRPILGRQTEGVQDVKRIIDAFEKTPFPGHANQLADADAIEAIPVLRKKFSELKTRVSELEARSGDADFELSVMREISSALVRLGVKEGEHWDFLLAQADIAVNSDVPYPFVDEDMGYREEYRSWAASHGIVDLATDAIKRLTVFTRLIPLAMAGDERALPLLRKGLLSPNPAVQGSSAKGLALLQDRQSIPAIIAICDKTKPPMLSFIVYSLLFFDDASAQEAAQRLLDREAVDRVLEVRRKAGLRGVFKN
jgi:hypothetical protein